MQKVIAEGAQQNFMTLLDWIVIAVYLTLIMYVGSRLAKQQTTSDRYFVANHRIPGWAAGISMYAALLSSFTFIAFPGWTYDKDWQLIMREAMAPFAVFFCAILVIPIYRQAIRMSAYEYLEKRFGYVARLYGTLGFLVGHFVKTAVVLFALALALSTITGVPIIWIILVLGLGTLIFTFFGGIEGVVWTEVIQGILKLVSGIVIILFLLFKTDTWFQVVPTAWAAGKFKVLDPGFDLTQECFWVFAFLGIFQYLVKYSTDQTMVQRYLLAPSVMEAIKGTLIGLLCCVTAWLMFFLIGSLLWGFYHLSPELLGSTVTKGDQVLPYFIGRELPAGLTGLVLAGLFASAQGTISGDLNCIGACVTSDFYDRFSKSKSDRMQLIVGKSTVLLSGLLITGLGILMTYYKGGIVEFTLDLSAVVGSIIGGGLLALFMLGFFTRRVTKRSMYFALGVSVIVTSLALLVKTGNVVSIIPGFSFHFWLLPIITNLITVLVALFASLFIFRDGLAPLELTVYGYDIFPKIGRSIKSRLFNRT